MANFENLTGDWARRATSNDRVYLWIEMGKNEGRTREVTTSKTPTGDEQNQKLTQLAQRFTQNSKLQISQH
jgi:hypothetical protein